MINIIGTINGTQGYAIHTRNLAKALNKHVPVKLITDLMPGWELGVDDEELEMIKRPDEADINLIIAQPPFWKLHTHNKINIGFLVFEGDQIPACWLEECLNPDIHMIFVPSEHTKQAIWDAYFNEDYPFMDREILKGEDEKFWNKVHVIPHGIDPELFKPANRIKVDNLNNESVVPFTFLCNKGFRNLEDRGGIQYAIQAYLEEFKKENVQLILKLNPAYPADVPKLLNELGYTDKSPKIQVTANLVDYKNMPGLYQQADVFLSPTRAEAFNIPCLEAMGCGLPVITSNFGGQTDYCTDKTGKLISGDLKPVQHEILYEETQWLTPSIKELREAMRDAYENDWSDKSKEARKVAKKYTTLLGYHCLIAHAIIYSFYHPFLC